jgi:hypothetical protein
VGEHRPLGRAGGAGREHHVGHVVGPERRLAGGDRVGRHGVGAGAELGPRRDPGPVRPVEGDDLGQARQRRHGGDQRRVVDAQEVGRGGQQPHAGGAQHVVGLAGLEARVERHEDGAGPVGGQGEQRPVDAVRRPDRHPVARGHAAGEERPGQPLGGALGLGVGQRPVVVDEGVGPGPPLGGRPHDGRDGAGRRRRHGRPLRPAPVTADTFPTTCMRAPSLAFERMFKAS